MTTQKEKRKTVKSLVAENDNLKRHLQRAERENGILVGRIRKLEGDFHTVRGWQHDESMNALRAAMEHIRNGRKERFIAEMKFLAREHAMLLAAFNGIEHYVNWERK